MEKLIHKSSGELVVDDPFVVPGTVLEYIPDDGSSYHGRKWYINRHTLRETETMRQKGDTKRIYVSKTIDGEIYFHDLRSRFRVISVGEIDS